MAARKTSGEPKPPALVMTGRLGYSPPTKRPQGTPACTSPPKMMPSARNARHVATAMSPPHRTRAPRRARRVRSRADRPRNSLRVALAQGESAGSFFPRAENPRRRSARRPSDSCASVIIVSRPPRTSAEALPRTRSSSLRNRSGPPRISRISPRIVDADRRRSKSATWARLVGFGEPTARRIGCSTGESRRIARRPQVSAELSAAARPADPAATPSRPSSAMSRARRRRSAAVAASATTTPPSVGCQLRVTLAARGQRARRISRGR